MNIDMMTTEFEVIEDFGSWTPSPSPSPPPPSNPVVPILLPSWPQDCEGAGQEDVIRSDWSEGSPVSLLIPCYRKVPRPRWTNRRVAFGELNKLLIVVRVHKFMIGEILQKYGKIGLDSYFQIKIETFVLYQKK